MSELWALLSVFSRLSVVAFGGGIGILPEMERESVGGHGWVDHQQFVDAFALSQVTPGPGMLMVVVIGLNAAGIPGALVAGLAMFGPTAFLTWFAANRWARLGASPRVALVRHTLAPVALGLLAAGCYTLVRLGVDSITGALVVAVAFLAVTPLGRPPWQVIVASALAGAALFR